MTKKKKGYVPRFPGFCATCGEDRQQGSNIAPGFCRTCEPQVRAAAAKGPIVVFCRKCRSYAAPDPKVHGRGIIRDAMAHTSSQLVIIVYEPDPGCPACVDELAGTEPYAMLSSLKNPFADVA